MSIATVKISVQRFVPVHVFDKPEQTRAFGSLTRGFDGVGAMIFKLNGKLITRGDEIEVMFPNGYTEEQVVQQDSAHSVPYIEVDYAGVKLAISLLVKSLTLRRLPKL